MISSAAAFVLACIATLLLTPLVRRVALRAGVVDTPGGRHVHEQVTPRLGGVAVIGGFFLPLALFAGVQTTAMRGFIEHQGLVIGLVLGSAVVGLIGGIDDVRSLGPRTKLFAQAVAAIIAYAFGYRIEAVDIPLFGTLDIGVLALPVTVFWFLAITNAINLIDGLDGLAAGIALFATLANFAIAYVNGSEVVVLLSGALAGSLLGFLRYNFNPATIFLGDSGSMFLGFVLAATSLAGATTKSSTAIAILAPMLALGVPIVDTMLAMIRRTMAGQSIFSADRGHIHHRLLDLGITHRRVVLMLHATSVALAFAAIAIAFGRSVYVGASLTLVGGVLFAFVRLLRRAPIRPTTEPLLESLSQLATSVAKAVEHLAAARDEAAIRQCLAAFGDGQETSAHLLAASADALPEATEEGALYDVSSGGRRRYVRIRLGVLGVRQPEVTAVIAPLVIASREALDRVVARTNASASSRLAVATAHGATREDEWP